MCSILELIRMGCVCGRETVTINKRRFFVKCRLGEGGFSYVDLIEDVRSHKLFALKRIANHSTPDEELAMKEVEIMKKFHHVNIIPLEDFSKEAVDFHSRTLDIYSELLIVMPFYKRGSIQQLMEKLATKSDKLKETQIWNLLLDVCQGVAAMHQSSPPIAHRDLKPANIMISDEGRAVLMDLGSATEARVSITSSSEALKLQDIAAERCSMLYRPPELFNVETGTTIDERTDIWSLGCVLYAMAFLEAPYENAYRRGDSIALAATSGNIKFPANHSYSASLEEIVRLMMRVNVNERPYIENIIEKVEAINLLDENRV